MGPTTVRRPGFGTWQLTDPTRCRRCVAHAIGTGYRHVDTAARYGNEAAVGRGIASAPVDRDDLYVATKVWWDQLDPDDVPRAAEASLDRLGLEYVDLIYAHWPAGPYDADRTLPALASLVDRGLARGIGVCNLTPALLAEAIDVAGDALVAHQFEMHPFLPNGTVRDDSLAAGLDVIAYSPLARGRVLDDPTLAAIADEHGATPAQVSLAWLMRDDRVVPIPKSGHPSRIDENFAARDLELTEAEFDRIDRIDRRDRLVDPGFAPW